MKFRKLIIRTIPANADRILEAIYDELAPDKISYLTNSSRLTITKGRCLFVALLQATNRNAVVRRVMQEKLKLETPTLIIDCEWKHTNFMKTDPEYKEMYERLLEKLRDSV